VQWWSATQRICRLQGLCYYELLNSFLFHGHTRLGHPESSTYVCPSLMLICRPCTQVVRYVVLRTLFRPLGNPFFIRFPIYKETPMDAISNFMKTTINPFTTGMSQPDFGENMAQMHRQKLHHVRVFPYHPNAIALSCRQIRPETLTLPFRSSPPII